MQDLLRRPLVPLEMTEENKKVALVNELLMDKNNFVYIKRADGTFPSIQDIIIEYLGGSMVFRGFVDTHADLASINLDERAIGDMWIVRVDETYKDPEDNTNIEYIVMEDVNEQGEKYRYWECLGNPFGRGIDEDIPNYGSTKLITSTAVFEYANNHFISAIKVNDDEDTITYTLGYQNSEDGKVKTKDITIGANRHRKVESRPDQSKIKYITGTPTNTTNNDVLLFDTGVYIGKTAGELNSQSFNTKAISVTDANGSANSKTIINGTTLSTAAGVSVVHNKRDFKVGLISSGVYDLEINDSAITTNNPVVNFLNISSFNVIGKADNSSVNIAGKNINIANLDGAGEITMGFSKLRMNNNLYFTDSTNIYNPGSELNINFDQGHGVNIGSSNSTSNVRGNWIFSNKDKYDAETTIRGSLIVDGNANDISSNIYSVLKANNKTGVSLYSKASSAPIHLADFTRSTGIDFYENVNLPKDKMVIIHSGDATSDTATDSVFSLDYLKLVDTSGTGQYTEYTHNKIGSTAAFNIEAPNITIGNSTGNTIMIGYKDSKTSSIKDSQGKFETIEMNGKVNLKKTTTALTGAADFGDIDDLYNFLTQLKKGWSEGLRSINSALALMGGGLDNVTETTNVSEIVTAIKQFRAKTLQDAGDSGVLYSTINGTAYRRATNTIYGNTSGQIKVDIKQFNGKTDDTYTTETKTLLTTSWDAQNLKWTSSNTARNGILASVNVWSNTDSDYTITPLTVNSTIDVNKPAKTIIKAGRHYFKKDVVVKSVEMTVPTYFTKDTDISKAPVEGVYISWDDESTTSGEPYIGINIKEGYYNSSKYKINNPIIAFNATSIDITKKPLLYGDVPTKYVLSGQKFSSSDAGYYATGTMPNHSWTFSDSNQNPEDIIKKSKSTTKGINGWQTPRTGLSSKSVLVYMMTLPKGYYSSNNGGIDNDYICYFDMADIPLDSSVFGFASESTVLEGNKFTSAVGLDIEGTMPNYRYSFTYVNGSNPYVDITSRAGSIGLDTTNNRVMIQLKKGYHSCYYTNDKKEMDAYYYYDLPMSAFGNATASDVSDQVTFTSKNGLAIHGTATKRSEYTMIGESYHVWNEDNSCLYVNIPDGLYNAHSASGCCEGTISAANIPILNYIFGSTDASNVLKGATFTSSKAGRKASGTMPNNEAVNASLDCGGEYKIPQGYHNGNGVIKANSLVDQTPGSAEPGDILNKKTAWVGGAMVTGTIPTYSLSSLTVNSYDTAIIVPGGTYLKNNLTISAGKGVIKGTNYSLRNGGNFILNGYLNKGQSQQSDGDFSSYYMHNDLFGNDSYRLQFWLSNQNSFIATYNSKYAVSYTGREVGFRFIGMMTSDEDMTWRGKLRLGFCLASNPGTMVVYKLLKWTYSSACSRPEGFVKTDTDHYPFCIEVPIKSSYSAVSSTTIDEGSQSGYQIDLCEAPHGAISDNTPIVPSIQMECNYASGSGASKSLKIELYAIEAMI